MLQLQNINLAIHEGDSDKYLLKRVHLDFPRGHFGAIVGPSGCGKSTLLKVIAGIIDPTEGEVLWEQRDLAIDADLEPGEIGYVPQFSIAHDSLTVRENVTSALKLRVKLPRTLVAERAQEIIEVVGLKDVADQPTGVLSGGQKRRISLALELTSNPSLLLCDEVTSGLDIRSEDQIVTLLRDISRQNDRIVLNVTHSLRHFDLYDSITVLYKGRLAYQGPPQNLLGYFEVNGVEDIYTRLARKASKHWGDRFAEEGHQYRGPLALENQPKPASSEEIPLVEQDEEEERGEREESIVAQHSLEKRSRRLNKENNNRDGVPGFFTQFFVLFARRLKIFFRERGQLFLQFALIVLFPAVVVIFALDGLPQIRNLTMRNEGNLIQQMKEAIEFTAQTSRVGGLVSGLILFQVVLLTLMGANNSAREIVAERLLFEKEKLAGLRVESYLASKMFFLAGLVVVQSIWMTIFVKSICQFPGDLWSQLLLFGLVNAAMTWICLGISAWAKTAEQASLVSVYFVGFQLPLSGAVLAMPDWIGTPVRPFIATYWSWSGILQTVRETRFYDLVMQITTTPLSSFSICVWVLITHVVIGALLAYFGSWRSRWDA